MTDSRSLKLALTTGQVWQEQSLLWGEIVTTVKESSEKEFSKQAIVNSDF